MSYEANLTSLLSSYFDGRFWWDTAPDDIDVKDGGVFCIVQQVGGTDQWYVDQSLPEWQNARVQFVIWGKRRIDVSNKADLLRQVLAQSIDADVFRVIPQGARVNEMNEALSLRGARITFEIWYRTNQVDPPDPPTGEPYGDEDGNTYVDELGNTYADSDEA